MKNIALFCDGPMVDRVYGKGRREMVAQMGNLYEHVVVSKDFDLHAPKLRDLEAIFSTWGMPCLTPQQLDQLPNLKAVFYAAGTVKGFASPLLERGILVCSAWAANGVPVAEFTLAQILLSMKGYFRNAAECRTPASKRPTKGKAFAGNGVFGETVALLGAGQIGRKVIELLRNFELKVVVYDPFLSDADAAALGVQKVSLLQAFEQGYVVSNHLANVPETVGMLNGALFEAMRPDATFINTGRGATVVESDLISVFGRRGDLTALLDVTYPEPPVDDSPLYTMPNIHLTSHIAGSMNDEVVRMADYMIGEFKAWQQGRPLQYAVTKEMLPRMA